MCETGLVLTEIRYMIRHVRDLVREGRGRTPRKIDFVFYLGQLL